MPKNNNFSLLLLLFKMKFSNSSWVPIVISLFLYTCYNVTLCCTTKFTLKHNSKSNKNANSIALLYN